MATSPALVTRAHIKARTPLGSGLRSSGPDDLVQPVLVFTGNRHNDHYEVVVLGKSVELPRACLRALIELVLARAAKGQGFVRLNPVTIFRLRRAIDLTLGAGVGKSLIETGAADEYRLRVTSMDAQGFAALTPCFSELEVLNVVSREQAARLEDAVK
jgi:hypothetical protein